MKGPILAVIVAAVAIIGAPAVDAGVRTADAAARHLRLDWSRPAADTVLAASPAEIRLGFSEAPQMNGTTVRLTLGSDQLVVTTAAAADPQDGRQVFIQPEAPLAAGTYTVHWRVLARDGHAQRGTFTFRIGG
ncbi:MAG TPA: copper resistance protein CopC [Longimicrobiales bacterium]|nr:copper resistance protein CopC [Longimicrobiales bacterium]